MAASSDGTTVTTAQDKDGNTFAVRAVEGDSYALAYPVSDNGDGTVSLGAPVQRSMSDFDKGSMASAPLETYLQGLSARQRAQGQAEDAAAREQDMAASLPPIRADRPMQAVRPVTYFTTDMKKEKAAVEGSRIEAVADVPEGTAADAPVRVVVTAPNGKAEPGVMTYGQLQGMLADGSAMESGPVRRDPEHRVAVSGASQGQQPLQTPQWPQGAGESVAQAGTGTVSGQQPGEVNRPAQSQPAVQGQGGVAVEPSGTAAMPQGQAQPGGVSQGVEAAVPAAQAVQATAQPSENRGGLIGRSLTEAEAEALISSMEANAETAPEVELNAESWSNSFDENNSIETPVGRVKMGDNQITKFFSKGREKEFGMVAPTLANPDVILEKEAPSQNAERGTKYLFIKTFIKPDGSRFVHFESVTVKKDGMEISISSHEADGKVIKKEMQNGVILHLNGKLSPDSERYLTGTPAKEGSDLVPTSDISETKGSADSGEKQSLGGKIAAAEEETNANPTEGQKQAGNYKKGHVRIGQFDISIENPKGSVRRGVDANGKAWEHTMQNSYGYIRGTEGVDGDHIDVFLSDKIDDWNGSRAFVIDQYNEDGTFDEHKVMLGFNEQEDAWNAYLVNYEDGWADGRRLVITPVNIEKFENWIASSHRKTKPFAEYNGVNKVQIPLDEEGSPMYEQAPVQATWDDLMARNGRDEGKVRYFAQEMKAAKDRELKAERKKKPKGKNAAELQRAMDEQQSKIGRLEQESSYWDTVLSMSYRAGEAAATEGARARQAEAGRKREASERGFPAIQARWESARKEEGMTPEGRKARLEERHRQRQEAETEARERLAGLGAQDNGEPDYHRSGERGAEAPTEAEAELRDAIVGRLRASGIEVVTDSEAGQRVLDEVNGRRENRKRKSANDTGLPERDALSKAAVISFADSAKIRNNLEKIAETYQDSDRIHMNTVLSELGRAIRAEQKGSSSQYVTIAAKNGNEVTIRLSDHNASVERMDNAGKDNAISIVISRKGNKGIQGTGKARMVEYYYSDKKLRQAGGKAVAAIARSLQQTLYSGEFKDTTGLADVDVKNADMKITGKVKFFRTPQGEAYGFTVGGKIYLDPRIATSETPVHEYAHLWAEALRKADPEEWRNIVGLMKDSPVWEEVKERYPELGTEDEIADEVLATYSGRRGAERLREAMRGASGSGDLGKALSAVEAMGKVREALQRFWHAVADFLHIRYTTAEEVADRVLKDLLEGVKPGGESQRLRLQSKDEALFSGLTPEARAEMETIKAKAEADGTYMKAPNGKPTNLSERQWLQVRTKAFKEWFGDWEKAARIEKLRNSQPVDVVFGNEYPLERSAAKQWLKENIKGEYANKDTGERISVSRYGIDKVTSHGEREESHLKSLKAIPQLIEESVFITEIPNEKGNGKYDSYRYYVCGIRIDGSDYTAKVVVGVKNGVRYYDHELTEIEKGSLIDSLNRIAKPVAKNQTSLISEVKDKRLLSILQADASKVVDENGEPRVVYHGSPGNFYKFDTSKIGSSTGTADGRGFYFTTNKDYARGFASAEGTLFEVFLNVRNPLSSDRKTITRAKLKQIIRKADEAEYGREGEHYFLSNYGDYTREGIENVISDAATSEYEYSDNDVELVNSLIGSSGDFDLIMDAVSDVTGKGSLIAPKKNGDIHYIVTSPSHIKSATDNDGSFSEKDEDIRFRSSGESGSATDMESKRAAVEALGRKLNVEVVFEDEASLRKQPRQYRTASGWFDRAQWRKDGRRVIHVNLSNTGDAHEAEMTVLHEAVGHMGLRELLGAENYDPFLDMVHGIIPEAQAGRLRALVFKGHPDLARRVGEGNADGKDRETAEAELRRVMADEWLAELAEVGGEPGVWEQIVESFRMLLRRLGFELSLSESDIRALLFESRRNLESSRLPGEAERIQEQQEEFREAARLDRIMEADMADMEADAGSEASSFRQWYGGNSGYVGYSMSRRAAEAREEGRFPKTDFKKEYHVSEHALKALVRTGFIDGSEWHHTSKYGNRTPFYGWTDEASAQTYLDNKKEVDALSKEYDGLGMASPDDNAGLFLEERMSSMRKERGYGMDFLTDGEKAERSRRLDEIGIADFGMDEAERARINAASEAVIDEYRELSGRRIREMESEIQGMDEYKNRVEKEGRKEARRKEIKGRLEEIFGQQETGPEGVLFRQGGGASARPTRSQRRQAERMFRDDKIISAGKEREWTSRQRFRHGMANLQEFFNDSVRLRYLGNHIRRMGGRVSSATDLYELATTVPAKEQYRSERFELSCGRPLVSCVREILQKTGKKVRDLELYMIAKHGPERNRWMYNRKKLGELADDMAYEVRNESGITRPLGEAAKNRIIASIMKEDGGKDSYMDAAVARKMAADIYEALSQSHAASMTQEAMKAQGKGLSLPKDNARILTQEDLDGIAEKTQSSLLERAEKDTDTDKDFSGLSDFAKTTGTNPENYVARFEEEVESAVPGGIDSFWEHLNAVTDFTLKTRLECGLMSEEAYQAVKDMGWSHYVPLRSWDARNPLSDDYMETDYKQREDSQAKVFHVSAMRLETARAEVGTYVEKLFGEEALVDEDSRPEIILIANKEDVAYLQ